MNEIFKRISVRKFEDRPVENEKLTQIMKAAMVESLRQEASDLVKMCKDGNFNIVYRYIGSKSGSKVDIKIKASEL